MTFKFIKKTLLDKTLNTENKKNQKIAFVGTTVSSALNFRGPLIKHLIGQGHHVFVLCIDYTEKTRQEVEALGAIPLDYHLNRSRLNPIKDVITTAQLARILSKHSIDLVFCFFSKPVIYGLLAARLARIPTRIAMLEGLGWAFTERKDKSSLKLKIVKFIQLFLYRLSFPFADKVILLNKDDLHDLTSVYRLKIMHPHILGGIGVEEKYISYCPPNRAPITFIFVGRLLFDKGIREFVKAARLLKQNLPEVRFMIFGDCDVSNPESLTPSDVEQLYSVDGIECIGYVENIWPYLHEASVLVLPSYREGFPKTVQEAMACGRPAIVTDVPGCRQAVVDGVNGFIVPPFSATALAEKMRIFIRDPDILEMMGYNAYTHAKQHYNSEKICDELGELMLLNRSRN
ncbi:MAG: glycosyltransferase family 4 protein [Pseudomonadota bacterium]